MRVTVDSRGRILVPKRLREELGLVGGSTIDFSRYGAGLQLIVSGRTARLIEKDDVLAAVSDQEGDDDLYRQVASGRLHAAALVEPQGERR